MARMIIINTDRAAAHSSTLTQRNMRLINKETGGRTGLKCRRPSIKTRLTSLIIRSAEQMKPTCSKNRLRNLHGSGMIGKTNRAYLL